MGRKIGLVGCGRMGSAIALGLLSNDQDAVVRACDLDTDAMRTLADAAAERGAIDRITTIDSIEACARDVDALVLAVKPYQVLSVLEQLAKASDLAVISVAAGVSTQQLRKTHHRAVRVMPNTPSLVGEGVTLVLRDEQADPDVVAIASEVFGVLGSVHDLQYENQMHAGTAVSGCGPAFVALFVEAMADGAVHAGLPRALALKLASETVRGSAALLLQEHPALVKDGVCSPGGSTIVGVATAERAGFRSALIDAVIAAAEKSKDLT